VTSMPVEHVLVIPTQHFRDLGYFQGFCEDVGRYLPELLSSLRTSYQPRSQMEQDPSFKQLIPYVIFQYRSESGTPHIFQYTRGKGQGEQRLRSKRSIGIGGHISSEDAVRGEPYEVGMQRELSEEVIIESEYSPRLVGLLNDDETEVGRVHLGVVHVFDVKQPRVRPREADILDAGFSPVHELLKDLHGFETWSQICLKALYM